jgi:MoaA/NifB/PqqE/SkfB family radical SAM enzyme
MLADSFDGDEGRECRIEHAKWNGMTMLSVQGCRHAVAYKIAKVEFGRKMLGQIARTRTFLKTIWRSRTPWQSLYEGHWPTNMNIEVTNICNANCIFCAYQYQDGWRSSRGIISDQLFQRAVDAHAASGGRFVGLTPVVGEPLIDPNICRKIRYVVQKGMKTSIFTNGILLDRVDLEALFKSGMERFSISTAPLNASIFRQIYRSNQYETLLHGLVNFLKGRNARDSNVAVDLSFRSHLGYTKTLSLPDFENLIEPLLRPDERQSIVVMNSFDDWAGQIRQADLLPGMRIKLAPRQPPRRPCKWLFIPMVAWDGKVRACACRFRPSTEESDELFVGDMNRENLVDIWSGEKNRQLRRQFAAGDPPLVCRKCPAYDPC